MPLPPKLRTLLETAAAAAREQARIDARREERAFWAKELVAAFFEAQEKVTKAWDRILDDLSDDISDEELEALPDPPEQLEADIFYQLVQDIIQHDKWPEPFHWKDV